MIKRQFRVWYVDSEPVEFRIGPAVQVAAEKHFKTPLGQLDRVEQLYWMAWNALTRLGKESRDFDTFLDAVLDVEPVELDAAPADPGQPGNSAI